MFLVNQGLVPSLAIQIATQTRAVSYSEVASVTVLTWDVLITFSDEVSLIWMKQWTPAKGLYTVVRYLPWLFQLSLLAINSNGTTGLLFTSDQCRKWMIFQAVILQLVITTVDVVLVMRVYALYNKSKYLLAFLATTLLVEIGYLCHNLAVVTPKLTFSDDCFVTSSPPSFVIYWIVSLCFETLLFALTLFKFCTALKDGWGRRPVMKEFVSDGTWAYALIFVTMLINSALYKTVHSPLAGVCFTWLLTVLSFAGSRLILNPRRRTNRASEADGDSIDMITIPLSPLNFTPTSPSSPGIPSPITPASRKSQYFVASKTRGYSEQKRRSEWIVPSSSSPIERSIQIHVHHEIDRLSFDSACDTHAIRTRSDVGLAV